MINININKELYELIRCIKLGYDEICDNHQLFSGYCYKGMNLSTGVDSDEFSILEEYGGFVEKLIDVIHKLDISTSTKKYKFTPDFYFAYIDEVGGCHYDGCGMNPYGVNCGECSNKTCKGCINENVKQ